MIVDLAAEGTRIGVTANSHKVIGELLTKVTKNAASRGIGVTVGQRTNCQPASTAFTHFKSNPQAQQALAGGSVDVVGATTWLWAREDMADSVDVLVIDEAGQMSLADAIAASPCAESLVLLGDPQQLDQPLKGVHPPGSECSVLAHLLHCNRVMPDHLGLFPRPHLEAAPSDLRVHLRSVLRRTPAAPSGPRQPRSRRCRSPRWDGSAACGRRPPQPVQQSPEEVDQVADLIKDLLSANAVFTDADGNTRSVDQSDVLIVSPYNAQVRALIDKLSQCRIGTVDKFQGQEAPVSIYSMATSSAEEAPRGMSSCTASTA